MIRLDLTTSAVTAESDGLTEPFITVRTLQTTGSASRVARLREWEAAPSGLGEVIEETIRSRQGMNVLREYDINSPGVFVLTSGRREVNQNRTFYVRVEFTDNETMQISVLPGSALCPWVVDDTVHQYRGTETLTFNVRVTSVGVGLEEGDITRIEDDELGVKYNRATAWERILQDD
jgi:hypothetical protein